MFTIAPCRYRHPPSELSCFFDELHLAANRHWQSTSVFKASQSIEVFETSDIAMKFPHPLTLRPFDTLSAGIFRSCQYEINGQNITLARINKGAPVDCCTNGNIGSGIIHGQGEIRLNDKTNDPLPFRNKHSI